MENKEVIVEVVIHVDGNPVTTLKTAYSEINLNRLVSGVLYGLSNGTTPRGDY